MQCLYCQKKLGLFASKKRPFCSEQHEVAYNDEQAGLAMRRVLDPLFLEPQPKAPLQASARPATPPPMPPPVGAQNDEPAPAPPPAMAKPNAPPPVAPRESEEKPAPAPHAKPSFAPLKPPPVLGKPIPQARLTPVPPGPDEALAAFGFMQPPGEARLLESGLGPLEAQDIEIHSEIRSETASAEPQGSVPEIAPEPPVAEAAPAEQPAEAGQLPDAVRLPDAMQLAEARQPADAEQLPDATRLADAQQPAPVATRLHPSIEQERPDFPVEEGHTPAMVQAPAAPLAFDAPVTRNLASGLKIETLAAAGEPAPRPEAIPPPGPTLTPSAALAPRVPDPLKPVQNQHAGQEAAPLDPPELALRFPFANLTPVHARVAAPQIEVGPAAPAAILWSLGNARGPAADPLLVGKLLVEKELRRTGPEPRTPQLDLTLHAKTASPAAAQPRVERPEATAAPTVRWKVLSALREAPAKLRHPQPASDATRQLGSANTQRPEWTLPPSAAVLALPVCEAQTWVVEAILPVRGEELDARVLELGSTGTLRQKWCVAITPASLALPVCAAQSWAFDTALPLWRQPESATSLGAAASVPLPWRSREPAPEALKAEDARRMQRIRNPRPAEPEGLSVMRASLMELARSIQADRRNRYRPSGLLTDPSGIQRAHAASFIQIREPEVNSIPSDLPSAKARLGWMGIRPVGAKQTHGSALPLRPALRNPGWTGESTHTL